MFSKEQEIGNALKRTEQAQTVQVDVQKANETNHKHVQIQSLDGLDGSESDDEQMPMDNNSDIYNFCSSLLC